MFDAQTSALLSAAPKVDGLNPEDLPALLTYHYASLVSVRLSGVDEAHDNSSEWNLERIADTYELIASMQPKTEFSRASAFVAATAQQILARRQRELKDEVSTNSNIDKHSVDPAISAILLFLSSEQYADANEAGKAVRVLKEHQTYEATIISEHIIDLSAGRLNKILERSSRWRRPQSVVLSLEDRALASLIETLITGIEIYAATYLSLELPSQAKGRFKSADQAFESVLKLSSANVGLTSASERMFVTYAGPHHLASLLLSMVAGMKDSSLIKVPSPSGVNVDLWNDWLRFRAKKFPYVWPNHREAILDKFYETGVSSVVVLPTGAGKTTVSSLKIAGVIARGKKVVFLAPTHALVEQLTEDLQEMFPEEILGSKVSSDFDMLLIEDTIFQDIEVMTPERCLAMLSFAPEAFSDVGLLVFDECHMLSPESGKIRRSLDSMLCVLGFNHLAPEADFLFLSAMLQNGTEVSHWLQELTGRTAVPVDLLWKPSRQARGVITYNKNEIEISVQAAETAQKEEDLKKGEPSKDVRKCAERQMLAKPYAIWGLKHNWLSEDKATASCITTPVLQDKVHLGVSFDGKRSIYPTPNANAVASQIATVAAKEGLKTIVFVNNKKHAISVAHDVSVALSTVVKATDVEQERWDALEIELGDLKHALIPGPVAAVPHNSSMLRLERELAERMFKRKDGAQVIVATPTLAQGLNLPAHFAILAGDKRADANGLQSLEAHELLNAAARAGRPGHLANGLVLLIPDPIISFEENQPLSNNTVKKLQSILPEDDHCVTISDPLEVVLDRLMHGHATDPDVKYTINRMAALEDAGEIKELGQLFHLQKSLGAFVAKRIGQEQEYDRKILFLKNTISQQQIEGLDSSIAMLASQSGLSVELVIKLKSRLNQALPNLPSSVEGWLVWLFDWLCEDKVIRDELLIDAKTSILGACGKKANHEMGKDDLQQILGGIVSWIKGDTISKIEEILGGEPNSSTVTKIACPRARLLINSIIPRGVCFSIGLVSHTLQGIEGIQEKEDLDFQLVECLSAAVRKGFDTADKLLFASDNREILGRVQAHSIWNRMTDLDF